MTKKSFVVILILSPIITYGVAILNDIIAGSVVSGKGGFPFTFASGSSTDGFMLTLNIVFWFIVIFIIWKLLQKIFKK